MVKKKKQENVIKYNTKKQNSMAIHNNVIINNGVATAYYMMVPFNYKTAEMSSIDNHISNLYNTMKILYDSVKELKFSIFQVSNIVTRTEVIKKITETIRRYNPQFDRMPQLYKDLITESHEDYNILAVQIDISKNVDIETQSLKEVLANTVNGFFQANFSSTNVNVDMNILNSKVQAITDKLQGRALPVDEKMALNIHMNKLFPQYDIIYNNFVTSHSSEIIANVKQEVYPHLGWAELSNNGVATVGFKPELSYVSILDVIKFPDEIMSENFNMNIPGLQLNVRARDKAKVELSFRKMRASVKEEYGDAAAIGDEDSISGRNWDEINEAITSIRDGRILVDVDAKIMVVGSTRDEMEKRRAEFISRLADMGVLVAIAPSQANSYIESFVKNNPKDYTHIMDLEYALSFNQDQGVSVGDNDSVFNAMKIGETI